MTFPDMLRLHACERCETVTVHEPGVCELCGSHAFAGRTYVDGAINPLDRFRPSENLWA